MTRGLLKKALTIGLVLALCVTGGWIVAARAPQTPANAGPTPPRLVVLLVVDQFAASHINMYRQQWTRGLKRLLDTGAYFPLAAYPYGYTVTCVGHNSIATGTLPITHGIAGNDWYDRTLKKRVTCTEAPAASPIGFAGAEATEHHAPVWRRALTFAEELQAQAIRPPQIVSLSIKARSAIGMAGRPGPNTIVVWAEDAGTWSTSDYYTKAPWPEVEAFVAAHPASAEYGQSWNRLLPASSYLFEDDAPWEPAPRTFPYRLTSQSGQPDRAFLGSWMRSPRGDAFLGDLAMTLVDKRRLGQQTGTDFLGVSFSGLDIVGHAFGPHSHEVQDMLAQLDVVFGKLFDLLDRTVGRDRYVVALSADHGVTLVPEQAASLGIDAGRIAGAAPRRAVEQALTGVFGEGTYVANFGFPYLYFAPDVLDRVLASPEAKRAVDAALLSQPGIARVYWQPDLAARTPTDDAMLHALRLSYVPDRSGDLVLVPRPYWIAGTNGTTHGSPYGYDQGVPVVLMGAGIRAGRYLTPATPVDIVPTLAALTKIRMSQTDGRVLAEALKP